LRTGRGAGAAGVEGLATVVRAVRGAPLGGTEAFVAALAAAFFARGSDFAFATPTRRNRTFGFARALVRRPAFRAVAMRGV
jgi:hypothetical protein